MGIVFLPGMMTGQILSGENPVLAIRYQIVVMFMLVASTVLTVSMVLGIVRRAAQTEPIPIIWSKFRAECGIDLYNYK